MGVAVPRAPVGGWSPGPPQKFGNGSLFIYQWRLTSKNQAPMAYAICCFTDGSKTEHGTGGGFVISNTRTETITEHSFKTKDYCTVFQTETASIKHAAEELISLLLSTTNK